jgi:HAD superfamily hydrolase (TIGR01509 family)
VLRALIFDFDGLILDTETAVFRSWERVDGDHEVALPMDLWLEAIGSDDAVYDPLAYLLERRPGLDIDGLHARRRAHRDAVLAACAPLPGVVALLDEAASRGLGMAVASSSERAWVEGHLGRLGLRERFMALRCKEDVPRVKPDPALYRAAAEALCAAPDEVVCFEDSPNGVAAARAAGMRCVAVPGPMTARLAFDAAHLRLGSLDEATLDEVLAALGPF